MTHTSTDFLQERQVVLRQIMEDRHVSCTLGHASTRPFKHMPPESPLRVVTLRDCYTPNYS